MTWILFVFTISSGIDADQRAYTQEFNSEGACLEAIVKIEKAFLMRDYGGTPAPIMVCTSKGSQKP